MFSEISSIHGQHVFLSFNFDCGIYSHSTYVHILCAIMDVSCNRCLQIHLLHFCFWRCTVGLIFAPIRLCHGRSAPKAFSTAQLLYICVKVDKGNNSLANCLYITTRLLLNCPIMWPRAATQNMCLSLMVLNYKCGVFDCV